ncbi:hypothetical protein JZ751_003288, partial [Albula glossodonta]
RAEDVWGWDRDQGRSSRRTGKGPGSRWPREPGQSATEEAPSTDITALESSDHSLMDDISANEDHHRIHQHASTPNHTSDRSLTDDVSANETHHHAPQHASTPNHTLRPAHPKGANGQKPVSSLQNGHAPPRSHANGAPPICTPPTASAGRPGWLSVQPQKSDGQAPADKRRLASSSTGSQHSLKTTAAQIQQVAGDDCCVHCVLACLFCELLSLCSVLAQCLACGGGCETCCCGVGASGGVACGEDACSAGLDCGILEDCCESSDCLEICLECCSICFPA